MSETTAVAVRQDEGIELVRSESQAMILMLERMVRDPSIDVDRVERLWAMKKEMDAQSRKERFFDALARVQQKAPRITKHGLMDRGAGKGQIAFAKREDIDAVMRPIYQAEGFSVTWDAPHVDGKIRVVGKFSAFGHSEEREWSCSPDASGGKQGPQAAGSTVSYGQRYISIMFWDIITEGEDTNGARREDAEPITQDQADTIRTRMNDLPQSRPGVFLEKLCAKYGVARPEGLKISQHAAAAKDVDITEKQKGARA